jgi:transcriptional regulator with XRE-family HTH domain
MTHTDWSTAAVSRIGAKVKALRKAKGLTAEGLAQQVETMGYRPYTRAALVNLELGRKRSVDVSELLVLARVLGTPPMLLIYPGMSAGEVEVLPGQQASSWAAAEWFSGQAPYQATDDAGRFVYDRAAYDEGARVLLLAQQEHELIEQLAYARRLRDAAAHETDTSTDELMKANRHVQNMVERLRQVGQQMVALGGDPFPVATDDDKDDR